MNGRNAEWTRQEHNEVEIVVNGEVVAKSSGPSPALGLMRTLIREMERRENENAPEHSSPGVEGQSKVSANPAA